MQHETWRVSPDYEVGSLTAVHASTASVNLAVPALEDPPVRARMAPLKMPENQGRVGLDNDKRVIAPIRFGHACLQECPQSLVQCGRGSFVCDVSDGASMRVRKTLVARMRDREYRLELAQACGHVDFHSQKTPDESASVLYSSF